MSVNVISFLLPGFRGYMCRTTGGFGRRLQLLGRDLALIQRPQPRLPTESDLADLSLGLNMIGRRVVKLRAAGEWRNERVNPFTITGRERLEAAHSDTLAWLFNPLESHGCGPQFLHTFLSRVFSSPGEAVVAKGTGVTVRREYDMKDEGQADIVVLGKDWCLVVEDKIDSAERKDQTKKYAKYWRARYPPERLFLAFLTRPGHPPADPHFKPVSYFEIERMIAALKKPARRAAPFLADFREHILFDLE